MSRFPIRENFNIKTSEQHFKHLPKIKTPFILKKAKSVYLYDIDGNKYIDFSLNTGTILKHSPSRFSQFMKNALSAGFHACGFYNKFLYKAQKNWKEIAKREHISFYSSFIDMLLNIINTHLPNKKITIGYTTNYLYTLLELFSNIINLKKIDSFESNLSIDLLIFEEYNDLYQQDIPNLDILTVKLHSRFLFRHQYIPTQTTNPLYFEFFMSHPFGGKDIGVLTGSIATTYSPPDFIDSIVFLEASKIFSSVNDSSYINFKHPHFNSYPGISICKTNLDPNFFLQQGIYLKDHTLYFSPYHTKHDIRRLKNALNEYFNQSSIDTLDQK